MDESKVTYTVRVYVMTTWPTGSMRGTRMRNFQITEDRSVFGAIRAIDSAVDQCDGLDLCGLHSPEISPNPAEEGWPMHVPGDE